MSIDQLRIRFGGGAISKENSRSGQKTERKPFLRFWEKRKAQPPAYVVPPIYQPGQPPAFENRDGDTLLLSGPRHEPDGAPDIAYEQWVDAQQARFATLFPDAATLNRSEREERFTRFLEDTQADSGMTPDMELDPHPPAQTRPQLRRSGAEDRFHGPLTPVGVEPDDPENTPQQAALLVAIDDDNPTLLEALMSHELMPHRTVDLNAPYTHGITPMHMATFRGNPEIIRLLAHYGANVNGRAELGITPLHMAAHIGQIEVVRMLLSLGADPELEDTLGYSALRFAMEAGHHDCLAALLGLPEQF